MTLLTLTLNKLIVICALINLAGAAKHLGYLNSAGNFVAINHWNHDELSEDIVEDSELTALNGLSQKQFDVCQGTHYHKPNGTIWIIRQTIKGGRGLYAVTDKRCQSKKLQTFMERLQKVRICRTGVTHFVDARTLGAFKKLSLDDIRNNFPEKGLLRLIDQAHIKCRSRCPLQKKKEYLMRCILHECIPHIPEQSTKNWFSGLSEELLLPVECDTKTPEVLHQRMENLKHMLTHCLPKSAHRQLPTTNAGMQVDVTDYMLEFISCPLPDMYLEGDEVTSLVDFEFTDLETDKPRTIKTGCMGTVVGSDDGKNLLVKFQDAFFEVSPNEVKRSSKPKDRQRKYLSENAALLCGLVKNMYESDKSNKQFEIKAPEAILDMVVDYLRQHDGEVSAISKPIRCMNIDDLVDAWDAQFIDQDIETIFELIAAANYMDIKGLLDLGLAKIATLIDATCPDDIDHLLCEHWEPEAMNESMANGDDENESYTEPKDAKILRAMSVADRVARTNRRNMQSMNNGADELKEMTDRMHTIHEATCDEKVDEDGRGDRAPVFYLTATVKEVEGKEAMFEGTVWVRLQAKYREEMEKRCASVIVDPHLMSFSIGGKDFRDSSIRAFACYYELAVKDLEVLDWEIQDKQPEAGEEEGVFEIQMEGELRYTNE